MEARATLASGRYPRILVTFSDTSCEEAGAMYAEQVVGGRWRNRERAWAYPLTVEKCREMRAAWGSALRVHEGLSAWYRFTAHEQRKQSVLSQATDARLPRVERIAPKLYAALAPDQRVGAQWIANLYCNAGIYGPEMGVGKTRAVLAGMVERGTTGEVLIVCPKISVRNVWGFNFAEFLPDVPCYLARGTRAQRDRAIEAYAADESGLKVLVVVAEMLRVKGKMHNGKLVDDTFQGYEFEELFLAPWDGVIVDESQKLLGALTVSKGTLMGEGLRRLPVADNGFKLMVSGTPFGHGGAVEGMFGSLHWGWPDDFSSFWRWAEEYFVVTNDKVYVKGGRGQTRTVRNIGPLRGGRTQEEFLRSFGPRIFRQTLEEVSPDHAGKLKFYEQLVELTENQLRQYQELSDNGEVKCASGGWVTTLGPLSEMTRARQVANGVIDRAEEEKVHFTGESAKLDMLVHNLRESRLHNVNGRLKVVVASQFNEFLDVVVDRLNREGIPCHYMTGSTSEVQRDRMMDEFQGTAERIYYSGPDKCPGCHVVRHAQHEKLCPHKATAGPRVFVMNGKAGGVSITLDVADEMHVLDEMFPPEANEQLYRRIFRRSRVHQARVIVYRATGTVDANISEDVAGKLHQQLKVLDGRRGRDIVRQYIRYREGK